MPIATYPLTGTVTIPGGGVPVNGAFIVAELYARASGPGLGFVRADLSEIATTARTVASTTDGTWQLELQANEDIDLPQGNLWRITYSDRLNGWGPVTYFIEMVAPGGWIGDLLVDDPTLPAPGGGGGTGNLGGPDVTGTEDNNTVRGIQRIPVDSLAPTYGQTLIYTAADEEYLMRLPVGGLIDIRDVPDAFGNCAAFDGVTHDGLAVKAAALWAHSQGLELRQPNGDCVMLDPDGDPVLIQFDQHAYPWSLIWKGPGKYQSILQYPVNLGLALDPTDLTLCGDPSGRVAQMAIDPLYTTKGNAAPRLENFGAIGPFATAPGEDEARDRGSFCRGGGRLHLQGMYAANWNSCVVFRPRLGSARSDKQVDHNTFRDCQFGEGCAASYHWNYYQPRSGMSPGDGDHIIEDGDASGASKASFLFSPDAVCFDSKIASIHKGAGPQAFLRESGPKGPKEMPAGATVARDTNGVVTLATLTTEQPSAFWPGHTIPAAFGFLPGDVVDLVDLDLDLAADDDQIGRVTAVTDPGVLTFLMEDPITGAVIGATDVEGKSIEHHYNTTRWLDSNIDHDGTDEGCGVSCMRCEDGDSEIRGYGHPSEFVFHGIEVIGRNSGRTQGIAPIPVNLITRTNITHPGFTAVDDDAMLVTVEIASGVPIELYDTIFLDSPDDNPPSLNWDPDPDRCRGKWRVNSVVDDDTTRTLTFLQLANAKRGRLYTEKTIGDGTPGSAGHLGRVAAVVCGGFLDMKPGLDIQHENQSGSGPAEIEIALGGPLRRSVIGMVGGKLTVVPNVRALPGTNDVEESEPVRSALEIGTLTAHIDHNQEDEDGPTSGAIVPGHVLERTGKSDVRLFRGGPFAGVALYYRARGDYQPYAVSGEVRGSEYGLDFPADPDDTTRNHGGVISRVAFDRGDVLAGDPDDPGMVRLQAANDVGVLRALGNSVGPRDVGPITDIYITAFEILEQPGPPVAIDSGEET